ncbi:hypothetical protein XEUV683_09300 [Xanthomonas euvesicatoria]|nr:hypothetical protein XEUV683_09300 [Xanthomonas euvesicatoria]KLA56855.1 hypothetical protein XEUV684_16700 [Xanthomonas euvesicatoria]KLB70146.1 hypothetical protein XEUV455_02620 [Xanthomonas euvesicatoria]PWH26737.1 hypothetical protein CEX93_14665 [Xanthomonas euvesicatoria]
MIRRATLAAPGHGGCALTLALCLPHRRRLAHALLYGERIAAAGCNVACATRSGGIRAAHADAMRGNRFRQPRKLGGGAYLIRRTLAGVL